MNYCENGYYNYANARGKSNVHASRSSSPFLLLCTTCAYYASAYLNGPFTWVPMILDLFACMFPSIGNMMCDVKKHAMQEV